MFFKVIFHSTFTTIHIQKQNIYQSVNINSNFYSLILLQPAGQQLRRENQNRKKTGEGGR